MMKTKQSFDFGAESGEDAVTPAAVLKSRLHGIEQQIATLAQSQDQVEIARLDQQAASLLLELKEQEMAWQRARPLFDIFFHKRHWQDAVEVCEILFNADQPHSLAALGQGVWISITFPMDPAATLCMLQYVIDETPDDADGAAVAAATALYVYELREQLTHNSDLYVDAMQMLSTVARRHSDIHGQQDFDNWIKKMELDNPDQFLPRMRNVIDVLVQDQWWFDPEWVKDNLPNDSYSAK